MLFKKADPQGEWLVVGLGNPGSQYDLTRHNVGFDAIDYLAQKWGATVNKAKFEGLYGQAVVDGTKVLLPKPQTYMNLSGRSIQAMAAFYKIPLERVVVLCDDITQNPGKIRIRPEGYHRPVWFRCFLPCAAGRGPKAPPGIRPGQLGAGPHGRGGPESL